MNKYDFVNNYKFGNPLQRLIMIRVLMSGSLDGEGERIIDHEILRSFCCCSKQMLFKEIKSLERSNFLKVRKIAHLTIDAKTRMEPARGYTISPIPRGEQ
ncbi:hypothetical protein [Serratia odorifera]|uniref:Transcriptional regulator n=2 Tax=Serratia odorifera TaxID=618 RepID=D4E0N1_SEROD|nr:hypothetical protein HMPREF0758_1731 [Serratia odorifera DSM 4582]VDZ56629.1 Uncharacterised protein [Serratia odorifera]